MAGAATKATFRATGYLASGLLTGPIAFLWTLAGSLTVAVLSLTRLGGPAFLGAAWGTRRLAQAERRRAGWVLGRPIAAPYLPATGGTVRRRVAHLAGQPATWRDLVWLGLLLPIGVTAGVLGLVVTVVEVGAILAPAWAWSVPNPRAPFPVDPLMTTTTGRLALALTGLVLLPVAAWLLRALALGQSGAARALLAPGAHVRLVEEAARLTQTRARVVDAQAAELRRIERDLHDGAQARIVAAGMTLALAERKLHTGVSATADVELARRQLDDALADLRRLVRGIHPPILTDRGLHAAVSALAGDSPLSVELRADPAARYPAAVESAAYFVAAEGLTNAGKHSQAATCLIELATIPSGVAITLTDDGVGGADPTGSGLDGLRRRVEALDGAFSLTSPLGGPTVLHVELPCES